MKKFVLNHPLVTVLSAAIIFRALAVLFSKGYMASDDHFETIRIAYQWLRDGPFAATGQLTWGNNQPGAVGRFPLYVLSLYAIMKVYVSAGVHSLDTMMYGIRAAHALFSLIPIWAVYRATELVTRSRRWAMLGGAIVALHFAMPYLAVRNLIEMVGGEIWIVAIYLLYRYRQQHTFGWVFAAGIVTGLAWMIRFELATAALVIPFVLWYDARRVRPAIQYSFGVLVMLLLSGIVDYYLFGTFFGSTLNHLHQIATELPPYSTSALIYVAVLLAFFVPPFSLMAFFVTGYKRFWEEHKLLVFSSLTFLIAHTLSPSRQERYMLAIVPALMLTIVLALWQHRRFDGFFFRHRTWLKVIVWPSVVINVVLLFVFTFNYSHNGLVEPLVKLERLEPTAAFTVVSPEVGHIYPFDYAGEAAKNRRYVFSWSELEALNNDFVTTGPRYYYILYPPSTSELQQYVDSVTAHAGPIVQQFAVRPSGVDQILHFLNPRHNRLDAAYVYRKANQSHE